jgi:type IV secretory pathway TraG/TraD family ATPase VirD4
VLDADLIKELADALTVKDDYQKMYITKINRFNFLVIANLLWIEEPDPKVKDKILYIMDEFRRRDF